MYTVLVIRPSVGLGACFDRCRESASYKNVVSDLWPRLRSITITAVEQPHRLLRPSGQTLALGPASSNFAFSTQISVDDDAVRMLRAWDAMPPGNVTVHYNLVLSYTVFEATTAMEDLKAALNEHVDLVSDLFEKFSAELRSGFGPAVDNFIGFFHAIDWKVCFFNLNNTMHLLHCCLCLVINKRKEVSYNGFGSGELEELCLFGCAGGVYLAERVNSFLGKRWQSFSSQNYFDPHGVFISVLWSGPLLVITILIVVNTLFTLCHLMVKWKKAELRHRARVGRDKQE
ncbi:hypothetical protein ZIOFF_016077 [Zingiber officinale]|uniref:Transmembrane protein 18 n=1 Tax=Zingiber officinale TaxID=94328 RepID=A0A8J5HKS5_ZINOF|nr:hypothetical protein ZIOFF_016077 [Zingiber officinale]